MRTATVTEAQDRFSALIDLVRSGESIVITDRGGAVAMLEPFRPGMDPAGRVERLQRAGVIRAGTGIMPLWNPPSPLGSGSNAVDPVLEERRSGR